jgi:hypothetical protein
MTAESFQSVDVSDVGPELSRLHQLVVRNRGRVEVMGADGESSVILSKTELDSLERAIELLSATDDVRELRDAVAHLAHEVVAG